MKLSKRLFGQTWPGFFFALWLAGCGGPMAGPEGEEVDVERGGLIGGIPVSQADLQRFGLVAIYHPKLPDFAVAPRPCSGVIVRSVRRTWPLTGWTSVVMTARHCVTRDGFDNGPIATPDMLRLIPAVSPGPAAPNAPTGAVAASSIIDLSAGRSTIIDYALVVVNTDWSAIASKRIGLYIGAPFALVGTSLTAFGYGVTGGSCASTGTMGAGTARSGGPFTITWGSSGGPLPEFPEYIYPNIANGGQHITCGDSGGPDFALLGAGPFAWEPGRDVLLGVHSNGLDEEHSFAVSLEIQQALAGLYLSALNIGSSSGQHLNVAIASTTVPGGSPGAPFFVDPRTDNRSAKMTYDPQARRIVVTVPPSGSIQVPTTGCLGVRLNAAQQPQPFLMNCDRSDLGQRWSIGPNLQIGNDSRRMCLVASSTSSVGLATCSATSRAQRWFFHAQP